MRRESGYTLIEALVLVVVLGTVVAVPLMCAQEGRQQRQAVLEGIAVLTEQNGRPPTPKELWHWCDHVYPGLMLEEVGFRSALIWLADDGQIVNEWKNGQGYYRLARKKLPESPQLEGSR